MAKRITIFMHREILGLKFGDNIKGDHRSVEPLRDNRRKNLRVADLLQNMRNIKPQANNKTGLKVSVWRSAADCTLLRFN